MAQVLFTKALRDLIFGTPFGETWPIKENPPPPTVDGRTHALRILKRYISELIFYRTGEWREDLGKYGPAVKFQIPAKNIHVEWPDHEEELVFPSIAFVQNKPATYEVIGLNGYVEEDTRDVYQTGTVLQWMSEWTEEIAIEIWASKKAERRAILSGLEIALSPTEQMYGIRFRMPDYFNELVCFSLQSREMADSADSMRDRRTARLIVEMRFNVVALVNYNALNMTARFDVDVNQNDNTEIDLNERVPGLQSPINVPRQGAGPADFPPEDET